MWLLGENPTMQLYLAAKHQINVCVCGGVGWGEITGTRLSLLGGWSEASPPH